MSIHASLGAEGLPATSESTQQLQTAQDVFDMLLASPNFHEECRRAGIEPLPASRTFNPYTFWTHVDEQAETQFERVLQAHEDPHTVVLATLVMATPRHMLDKEILRLASNEGGSVFFREDRVDKHAIFDRVDHYRSLIRLALELNSELRGSALLAGLTPAAKLAIRQARLQLVNIAELDNTIRGVQAEMLVERACAEAGRTIRKASLLQDMGGVDVFVTTADGQEVAIDTKASPYKLNRLRGYVSDEPVVVDHQRNRLMVCPQVPGVETEGILRASRETTRRLGQELCRYIDQGAQALFAAR